MYTSALPPDFLPALVAEIDHPDYVGILLGGSYARGDAAPWSDLDIACIVPTASLLRPKTSFYRGDLLVTIAPKSIEGIRSSLLNPDIAIVVARGIGDSQILLDKDGSLASLLAEVRAFTWDNIRETANARASFRFMLASEMAHKVANELTKGDPQSLAFPVSKLFTELTHTVAIGLGVLVQSDNTYYRQVRQAAGPPWNLHHRAVSGADGPIPLPQKAVALLQLYRDTVTLLEPIMQPDHLALAQQTVALLQQRGLI
jgi:predicted nucleotidyltransferase